MDADALRREYSLRGLERGELDDDPAAQLRAWFDEAVGHGLLLPDAMTLATVADDGGPDARVVLMRGLDERGIVFYTNYRSAKGRELEARPLASLVFWWGALERQVRVRGNVERTSAEESDRYWESRPRASRLGACASRQSEPIEGRNVLERAWERLEAEHGERPVPRPEHWGGYRLVPDRFEFWQGRRSRLHDRFVYTRTANAPAWRVHRLAP